MLAKEAEKEVMSEQSVKSALKKNGWSQQKKREVNDRNFASSGLKPTINDDHDHGATALLLAAAQSQHKVVELLLAARSSVVAADFRGRTALHYAARANSCQVVELLLAACPTLVDVSDEEGCTALLDTLHEGNNEAIINQLLAANPQKLDAMDTCGMNALHMAMHHSLGGCLT